MTKKQRPPQSLRPTRTDAHACIQARAHSYCGAWYPAAYTGRIHGAQAISEVDVVAKLEKMASAHTEKLNWKVSIVDLMKLLDLDSSLAARKELAKELGAPADKMGDSAQMNMWLHKTVLRKLAENGGNILKELCNPLARVTC